MTDVLLQPWGGELLDWGGGGWRNVAHPTADMELDGVTNDRSKWAALDAAYAYDVPSGVSLIGTDLTFAPRALRFAPGAMLKTSGAAIDLTLDTEIIAGEYQIFDVSDGGKILLPALQTIHARWFGAHPANTAAENAAAINAAMVCAQDSGRHANVSLGGGVLDADDTLLHSGAGKGITVVGTPYAAFAQGSQPAATTIRWQGGADPLFRSTNSFNGWVGFCVENWGTGTAAIKVEDGSREMITRMTFGQPDGSSPWSDHALVFDNFGYSQVDQCEFYTAPAIRVSGDSAVTTLEVSRTVFGANAASNDAAPYITVNAAGDILKFRNCTFNFFEVGCKLGIDMTGTTNPFGSIVLEDCEVDYGGTVQAYIGKIHDVGVFAIRGGKISGFGDAAITAGLVQLYNSKGTYDGGDADSVNAPIFDTNDATSHAYPGVHHHAVNAVPPIDSSANSGNYPAAVVSGGSIVIQGNLASPMAHAIFLATITEASDKTVSFAQQSDSSNKGYMTKGQVITLRIKNDSGAAMGNVGFYGPQFVLDTPTFTPPPTGKSASITFLFDGTYMVELGRQVDPTPTWITKTANATLSYGERRVKADSTSATFTCTLPRCDTTGIGTRFTIMKIVGANTVHVNASAGYNVGGVGTYDLTTQWSSITVENDGGEWIVVAKV